MQGRRLAGLLLMDLWLEEEENRRKAEEFKIRRHVLFAEKYTSKYMFSSTQPQAGRGVNTKEACFIYSACLRTWKYIFLSSRHEKLLLSETEGYYFMETG